ncbi:Domain of unknown function DUF4236 [Burkholderiales bacterium]
MGLRFQKRIKILPGLRLNVSKTGISWTVGTRGASVTARDGKLTGNVGVPGTGLSYRKRLDLPDAEREEPAVTEPANRTGWLLIIVFVVGVLVGLALK